MEEKTPEFHPDDIDDTMGSSSPDSGLCDLDQKSLKKDCLLDPLLYNRRLTLLKSLSQDSEYSLDTSLFDAEEFLQDMGFAGYRDPTIPDRFLPSLMQRLSRCPESEMESLHDRIIQSIGCFKRKEGKRRLFRNLSMGKDPRRRHLLGCPAHSHPLLRSNTDPSSFPYEETSSTASSMLQSSSSSSRLQSLGSSKDDSEFPESPIAILVSAASVDQDQQSGGQDEPTAEKPALLTDAASQADLDGFFSAVEGIQKLTDEISVQEIRDVSQLDNKPRDNVSQLDNQPRDNVAQFDDDDFLLYEGASELDDDVCQLDDNASSYDNNVSQADGDVSLLNDDVSQSNDDASLFDNNVSRNDDKDVPQPDDDVSQPHYDISQPDDDVYQPDEDLYQFDDDVFFRNNDVPQANVEYTSNGLLIKIEQGTPLSNNNLLSEAKRVELSNESGSIIAETDATHNYNSLNLINCNGLDKDLSSVANIISNVSESQKNNGKFSNTKTPLRRTSNAHFYNPKSLKTFVNLQYEEDIDVDDSEKVVKETSRIENKGRYSIENENPSVKLDKLERALNGTEGNLNGDAESRCLQNESLTSAHKFQSTHHDSGNKFIKPKYSRDDSLTNFLSSMLDTSNTVDKNPSILTPNPETKCNSDSEMAGSFASSPFISFSGPDVKSKSHSSQNPKTTFMPAKSSKSKESIDKAPNRKRRVLRRMSSSLQCCDDVNCNDSNGIKVDGDVYTSTTTPFLDANLLPKLNYGSFKPVSSSHRVVHSCSSLPVDNLCRDCNARWGNDEISDNAINCQTNIFRNCCGDCDTKRGRNLSCFRKCKRRRNLSCPSPEISMNESVWFKPNQCVCMMYNHTPHFIESNRHKSLVLPCHLSNKKKISTCRCFNESTNHRLNLCCNSSPSNIFHSPNAENCDSNVRCIGPPSPSNLQPNNDVFTFGPNLWNQNRHLCYSSPDLRQECCNNQFEHCRQRSFTNIDDCFFNSLQKHSPQSFRGDNIFTDEVFSKNPCRCCSFHHNQCSTFDQDSKKPKISVRTPQRQNSISIADSEIPTSIIDSNTLPISCFSNKDVDRVKEPISSSTIPKVCLSNDNRKNDSSSSCVPKASHLHDPLSNKSTSDLIPSLTPSNLKTEDANEISSKSTSSPPTKSEALLERKIRIFSKFLANLGNLSKSAPDTDIDNKHKRITRDQKFSDVPSSDKKTKHRAFRVSCPAAAQSRRHSAEFDKLISLLKSMDLSNKNAEGSSVPNEKSDFSEQSEVKKHPVYENKVQLQASDNNSEGRRSYKPVLYSSSVSLYINSEDQMDTQNDRNEKADSIPGGDKKIREAPTKEEHSHNRLSHQMSFRGVSKEIEDLQLSIQKAKEMRMCASKELHLLQELLSMDVMDENTAKEKISAGVGSNRCGQEAVSRSTGVKLNQALTDLREKSKKKEVLEDTSFWKEEIQKVKEETKQAWQSKLDRMESRLLSQEEELRRLQSDNEALRLQTTDPHCRTTENGRTDSAFEDDEEYTKQPSTPIPWTRQECDRLQQRLMEEEQRADQLNLMLNQKMIELNKIQITLSKQTKEMIELEKSYLQLQCRLRRGTSKPVVSRLCSRSSPFSPKNLIPKPSPPASPQPTNGTT